MTDLPLGVSTWSFNGVLPQEVAGIADGGASYLPEYADAIRRYYTDLADVILASKIKSVELWYSPVFDDAQVFDQLKRLADEGRVSSMHAPFGKHLDLSSLDEESRRAGVDACISAARILARLHGKTLVTHGSIHVEDSAQMPERARQTEMSIAEIADHCRDMGLNVAVEILAGMTVGNSGPEMLALLELIGRPNVGVCIDVNHVFPTDQLIPTVHLLGPRILTLHISDHDGIEEKHWLPMHGVIDWPGLIHALREVNYPGPFMYEVRFEASTIVEVESGIEENYRKLTVDS